MAKIKFKVIVDDWGEIILDSPLLELNKAIQALHDSQNAHPGGIATVICDDLTEKIDFGDDPYFEEILTTMHAKVLRARQKASALATNKKLKSDNPEHYRKASLSRFKVE